MEIKVDAGIIVQVIEAIKQLPVRCDFNAADNWVGIVMLLESLLQQPAEEANQQGG